MIREMRLWELVSAFRTPPELLSQVLSDERWLHYRLLYQRFGDLVSQQDRTLLDSVVPLELSREVARRCGLRFQHDPTLRRLWLLPPGRPEAPGSPTCAELSALEVHDQFGGDLIEEVLEYGSAQV